jgi:hypothetical protein
MSDYNIISLYQPTSPSPCTNSGDGCVDLGGNNGVPFSCTMNGNQADSYLLTIKDTDNNLLYSTGTDTKVYCTDSNIFYGGIWNTSQNSMYDDTSANISYCGYGWNQLNQNYGVYNNTAHQSKIYGDYILFNFVGTGIECYFTKGMSMGIFQIYIDDINEGIYDNYQSTNYGFQSLCYSITDLAYGKHTIKILVTGNKNGSANDTLIEFDYFKVLNSNGSKNSNSVGSYFQYTFTNNGVNLYMDKTPNSGIIQIYIDNNSMGTVDLYSSTYDLAQLIYTNLNLSTVVSHTIKIVISNNKNSQSNDCYCYFNSMELINKTILSQKLYDKDTFSLIIPSNAITKRGVLKWQISFWNSDNNNEMVTSSEFLFSNITTPTLNYTVPSTIASKSYEFDARTSYNQAEKIPVKKYNYKLYALNYQVDEGYFGANSSGTGVVIDEGTFTEMNTSIKRYMIDEGNF